jgi:hypothetical protein
MTTTTTYALYRVATRRLIANLDGTGLESLYKITVNEVEWAIEEYGVCKFEIDGREFAVVHSKDELPTD